MKETCDMHIHTHHSDGNLSGSELLEYATKRGLKKLSITDHDCVDFYLDKKNIDTLKDFDYVTGCEFVCAYEDVPIEILGYGIDVVAAKKYLDEYGVTENMLERYRSNETPKVFAKHGVTLKYDPNTIDFTKKCPMVLEKLHEVILQDPVASQFLYRENPNLLNSVNAFLRDGLNNPASKIFIAPHKVYPSYQKITEVIRGMGGMPFLAHPYQYGKNMNKVLEGVKSHVCGVECYHPSSNTPEKIEYLESFCHKNNLMISGGSDFHIQDPNGDDMLNKMGVPAQYFDEIKSAQSCQESE